jgi:hypothetical protein
MNDQAIQLHQEPLHPDIVSSLVLDGDIKRLSAPQRVAFYVHSCRRLGIDPGAQPFQLINLSGKLVLYPRKECAQELTRIHRLSVAVLSREVDDEGIMTVCARATRPDGSFVDDDGVVDLVAEGAKIGKTNARMKCVTKAKRRAVLGACGLGGIDAEDVPGARVYNMNVETGEIEDAGHEGAAIDVGMSPADRIVVLVSQIADATKQQKRAVYEHAVLNSGIPHNEYESFPWRASDLEAEDAAKVAAFLEVHKKSKRSSASEAKPRPRPQTPEPEHVDMEEPPF